MTALATLEPDRRPLLADLLLAAARADGAIGDEERSLIEDMLSIDVRLAEHASSNAPVHLPTALASFREDAYSVRVSLLSLLSAVGRADGPLGELEHGFILEVARWLGLASARSRFVIVRPPTLHYTELVEVLRVPRPAGSQREESDIREILRPRRR